MTFTTLAQQTSYSDSSFSDHDITPVGTDEAEFKRYKALMGEQDLQVNDFTDDFVDAGFIPDATGNKYA